MQTHGRLVLTFIIILSVHNYIEARMEEPHINNVNIIEVTSSSTSISSSVSTTLTPVQVKAKDSSCWSMNANTCSNISNVTRCIRIDPDSVFCCNITNVFFLKEGVAAVSGTQNITNLHVYNLTMESFNVSIPTFRTLRSLSITDGNITRIVGQFKRFTPLTCLNVSNNNIKNDRQSSRALVNLNKLLTLDVSRNNLTEFPLSTSWINRNVSLDMSGNDFVPCKEYEKAMENASDYITFFNYNKTYCVVQFQSRWFKEFEKVPIEQIRYLSELNKMCKKIEPSDLNCTCKNERWSREVDGVNSVVAVDCSQRNLKELPSNLPPNTIKLNVSYNNIKSLEKVSEDDSYQHLKQLFLDHNDIENIVALEGTKFIEDFSKLSLVGNKLKHIQTYVFSNSFDTSWTGAMVLLADNPLHCDCNTEKVLKTWLTERSKNIQDFDQIRCDGNLGRVIDLIESQVCQQEKNWTDYIYYVITLEVLVIVGLVSKVSYDYWVFKTKGYLPWPANKMPRLPCDWLCE